MVLVSILDGEVSRKSDCELMPDVLFESVCQRGIDAKYDVVCVDFSTVLTVEQVTAGAHDSNARAAVDP